MANILPFEKKVMVVPMLAEGSGIRSIERITGIHRDTVMRLGIRIGKECVRLHDTKMRNLTCKRIEVDEIWGFIGAKRKIADKVGAFSDVWTFIAIDADSKLIPIFIVGKRDSYHADTFMAHLATPMVNRIQITTDALSTYPREFGADMDYAQVVKTFSVSHLGNFKQAAVRYSPAEVVKTEKHFGGGLPMVRW